MTERVTSLWLSEPGEGDRDPACSYPPTTRKAGKAPPLSQEC